MTENRLTDVTPTMTLRIFWEWLTLHPNCILRAGNENAVVFDDEDYHWHLGKEPNGTLLVQVIRGKRLVAELGILPESIAFVQGGLGDHEGEFVFELFSGDESNPAMAAFFVLAHGFDSPADEPRGRVH